MRPYFKNDLHGRNNVFLTLFIAITWSSHLRNIFSGVTVKTMKNAFFSSVSCAGSRRIRIRKALRLVLVNLLFSFCFYSVVLPWADLHLPPISELPHCSVCHFVIYITKFVVDYINIYNRRSIYLNFCGYITDW